MRTHQKLQRRSLRKTPTAPATHLAMKQPRPEPEQLELFPFLDGAARLRFGVTREAPARQAETGGGTQGEEGPQERARRPREPL